MNTHEDYRRELITKGSSDRSFGFWIGAVLFVLGLVPLRRGHPVRSSFLFAGVLVALIGLLGPRLLYYPNLVWTRFGLLLGRVMQPLVMTILFYVVFAPIGFVRGLFRKDPMRTFRDDSRDSYWLARVPPGPLPVTMRNQY